MLNCDYWQHGQLQHCITETTELDCVKSAKGLKILHLNVRSLLKHLEEIKYDLLDGSLDVIILSEKCRTVYSIMININRSGLTNKYANRIAATSKEVAFVCSLKTVYLMWKGRA